MKIMPATRLRVTLTALSLAALACRPVIAVGVGELAVFVVLFLVLLGPPLFRFWVKWEAFKRDQEKRKNK